MRRTSRKFHSHTIHLKKGLGFATALVLLAIALLPRLSLPEAAVLKNIISTKVLIKGLERSLGSYSADESGFSFRNLYDVIAGEIPSARANEEMSKKYAVKYNDSIRAKRTEQKNEKEERQDQVQMLKNKKIQTINMAAKGITFNNASDYSVDADTLLSQPLQFVSKNSEPRVLIVHTHTSEAYFDSPDGRSEDPQYNVVRVGDEIAKQLNSAGIKTIHDTTRNDYPSYNGSYKKALGVIQQNLLKYPTIEVVLDVHRDYTVRDPDTENEIYLKPTMTQDGKDAAQIMFVMGTDSMGLDHPNWRHNLSFAVKIQNRLNQTHPNFCRPINIRTERFNEHMTKGSMIIEVGSSSNTLEEAILAGNYVGSAIADILKEN